MYGFDDDEIDRVAQKIRMDEIERMATSEEALKQMDSSFKAIKDAKQPEINKGLEI